MTKNAKQTHNTDTENLTIVRTTKAEFFKRFGKLDFSNNVRETDSYKWERLAPLFDSMESAGMNTTAITLADVEDQTLILEGHRRVACLEGSFTTEAKGGKEAVVRRLPDSFIVQYVEPVKISKLEYQLALSNQGTVAGLSKIGKYNTVKNLVMLSAPETAIIKRTGLSKGSVQTPSKMIRISSSVGMLDEAEKAYLAGDMTSDDVNALSLIYNSAIPQAEKDKQIMEKITEIVTATHTPDIKPFSWKAIRTDIRPFVKPEFQRFIDFLQDSTLSRPAEFDNK